MDSEIDVMRVSDGLQRTLGRITTLVSGLAVAAAVVGAATFATGWWVFDGSRSAWLVIGGALCLAPLVLALMARFLVSAAGRLAPELVANIRQFTSTETAGSQVLIDHDTGQPVAVTTKRFAGLRQELFAQRKQLPALYAGVIAITRAPGLAALSVLGILGVGALGTILLIGGLID